MQKYLLFFLLVVIISCSAENNNELEKNQEKDSTKNISNQNQKIIVGAEQTSEYLPFLKNKNIALLVNHSSIIDSTHLVDSLLSLGINIKKIFAPEHGFRGKTERGKSIDDKTDPKTGLPIIFLIGRKKRPSGKDLADIDLVIYDIQDVGVRFYTYISSMFELMQACAEHKKSLLILDRPNPNGDYIAGPVLDTANYRSFVGMLPIPVVYGLTPGELAKMINGEGWLKNARKCDLKIIKIKNYNHSKHYSLPVKPSPNLPNDLSIRLYPSLCFFEATKFSIGRGTEFPFQVIGYPDKRFGDFTFTPQDIAGVQTNPIQEGKLCYGIDLRQEKLNHKFTLKYLIDFHKICADDIKLVTNTQWFNLLMGNSIVLDYIQSGFTEKEIKKLWKEELSDFNKKRKKYLLYALN